MLNTSSFEQKSCHLKTFWLLLESKRTIATEKKEPENPDFLFNAIIENKVYQKLQLLKSKSWLPKPFMDRKGTEQFSQLMHGICGYFFSNSHWLALESPSKSHQMIPFILQKEILGEKSSFEWNMVMFSLK